MKKLILGFSLLVVGLSTTSKVSAQQDPQFTQFFYNKLVMNPAYAGSKEAICVTLLNRNQWIGFEGAPMTTLLSFDMPIKLGGDNELGVGLTTYMDFIGFSKNYSLKAAAAYRRKNLGPGSLSIGIDFGFVNSGIYSPQWIYPSGPEAGIPTTDVNNFVFDLNAGLYYHGENFYAGVSAMHLGGFNYKELNTRQARHMYFMGGYTFKNLNGSDFSLNPNVLVKTDFATAQLDVNLNVIWREFYWAGVSYRIQDAVAINLGLNFGAITPKLDGLLFGISYDINTSRLSKYNGGSVELFLRYCFSLNKTKVPIKMYNVRFMDSIKYKF